MKSKISFRDGILHYLIFTPKEKIKTLINTVDGSSRSGLPLFFYRFPLYTHNAAGKTMLVSEDYGFEISRKLTLQNLLVLEYLFEEAEFKKGGLSVNINIETLNWRFGEMGFAIASEMQDIRFTAHKDKFCNVNFPLFSSFAVNNRELKISFSDEVSALFLVDYLIPTKKIRELLDVFKDDLFQSILFRYAITPVMAIKAGMTCDLAVQRIGFGYSPQGLKQFADRMCHTHRELFVKHGIYLDKGVDKNTRKIRYIDKEYSKELHVFPAIKIKDAMEIEENEVSEETNKEIADKGKKKPLDFENITLNTKMIDKALDLGYKKSEIDDIFTMFINTYSQYEKPYYQLTAIWGRFLKNNNGFTPVSKVENRGLAETITLNDDMKTISAKYDLSVEDEIEMFTMFRNYYISNEVKKKSWIGIWENWIIRGIQNRTKDSYKDKIKLETDFYAARLVSKDIELVLEQQGISVGDVATGKTKLQNIGYRNYPLPPSVGKGEITLFFWTGAEAQFNAMSMYLADRKKTASQYIAVANNSNPQKRLAHGDQ